MDNVRTIIGRAAETAGEVSNSFKGAPEDPETEEARKNREAIVQGLLMGRVVWADSFCLDLVFYLKQTHVFLSIFLAHEMHPFSRAERFFTWVASLLASFGFSMLFLDETGKKDDRAMIVAAGLLASIWMTIMYTITTLALTCSCVQEGSCLGGCIGGYGRSKVESFGRCIGCLFGFISAVIFAVGLMYGKMNKLPIKLGVQAWAYSQGYSLVLGVAIGFGMFLFSYYGLRCCCCCACCCPGQAGDEGSKSSSMYPHGMEYPIDKALFWAGDRCSCVGYGAEDGGANQA